MASLLDELGEHEDGIFRRRKEGRDPLLPRRGAVLGRSVLTFSLRLCVFFWGGGTLARPGPTGKSQAPSPDLPQRQQQRRFLACCAGRCHRDWVGRRERARPDAGDAHPARTSNLVRRAGHAPAGCATTDGVVTAFRAPRQRGWCCPVRPPPPPPSFLLPEAPLAAGSRGGAWHGPPDTCSQCASAPVRP